MGKQAWVEQQRDRYKKKIVGKKRRLENKETSGDTGYCGPGEMAVVT